MTVTPLAERPSSVLTGPTVLAPRRFDVHAVPSIESQISEIRSAGADSITVDCSAVSFLDMAAVETLVGTGADRGGSLRISNPSSAVLITLELLGHAPVSRPVAA